MIFHEDCIQFKALDGIRWLRHCFTARSFMEARPPAERSREGMVRRLREKQFPDALSLAWGEQVHGRGVAVVRDSTGKTGVVRSVDSLISAQPGVCLVAFGADCPIVYIADREKKVIALVHSGRKGCEQGIVTACVREMQRVFESSMSDCICVVSPSIGPCCYPTDLWQQIDQELGNLGLGEIVNVRCCSSCRSDLFYSYRREREKCGRMLAAMMITTGEG
ncbi:MAG: polyphenol oxidase family protein [Candidatus Aureabacteria bacterium]|nr:polyphenol oxidase family protein [Candidatus Auribacterota bacterium]